eukprot:1968744-Amphidinium_carterae.1
MAPKQQLHASHAWPLFLQVRTATRMGQPRRKKPPQNIALTPNTKSLIPNFIVSLSEVVEFRTVLVLVGAAACGHIWLTGLLVASFP